MQENIFIKLLLDGWTVDAYNIPQLCMPAVPKRALSIRASCSIPNCIEFGTIRKIIGTSILANI